MIIITVNGKTQSIQDWSKQTGVSEEIIRSRHGRNNRGAATLTREQIVGLAPMNPPANKGKTYTLRPKAKKSPMVLACDLGQYNLVNSFLRRGLSINSMVLK